MKLFIFFALCFPLCNSLVYSPTKIAAWNLQNFGPTKQGKPQVINQMAQVMLRYDAIMLQEVDDIGAVDTLLARLNQLSNEPYNYTISEEVGAGSKEQYCLLYLPSKLTVDKSYNYKDVNETFTYDPFIIVVTGQLTSAENSSFILVGLHATPKEAEKEISELVNLYEYLVETEGIDDVLMLGDFNSGCSYVSSTEVDKVKLYNDTRFTVLINEHQDTTIAYSCCPYDRIVAAGSNLPSSVISGSAKPYYWDIDFNANRTFAKSVSDHYPVEVHLKSYVPPATSTESQIVTMTLEIDGTTASVGYPALETSWKQGNTYITDKYISGSGDDIFVSWTQSNWTTISPSLISLNSDLQSDLLSEFQISIFSQKLRIQPYADRNHPLAVTVSCKTNSNICSVKGVFNLLL